MDPDIPASREIPATEANQRFSEVLREVASGSPITVTSRGRPVVRMVPINTAVDSAGRAVAAAAMLDFVAGLPIRQLDGWTRADLYD